MADQVGLGSPVLDTDAMKFLSQALYFERAGRGFVYRPTIFSPGFALSLEQKDALLDGFRRLDRRFLVEGFGLIGLIAAALSTGLVRTATPVPWFIIISIAALLLLALSHVRRRRRAVERVLGHYTPDVPRLPFRQALTRPRPVLAKRYALPLLRSVSVLFLLVTVIIDLAALTPVVAALLPQEILDQVDENGAITEALAQTLYKFEYWILLAVINVFMLSVLGLLIWEMRRLRDHPDLDDGEADKPFQ